MAEAAVGFAAGRQQADGLAGCGEQQYQAAFDIEFFGGGVAAEAGDALHEAGGFAFEVQLSITEKGRYAVAYGLSCKKDCHGLHTTDPRRTISYPIPVTPLHHNRNRQTA